MIDGENGETFALLFRKRVKKGFSKKEGFAKKGDFPKNGFFENW